jgi:ATP-dependent DNA helicase RecG
VQQLTFSEITEIIACGESEMVEFKTSFNDEALETIGAFANTQGGTLLIGVANSGDIIGINIGNKTLEDMANRIQEATDPRIQPSILQINYDAKVIVVILVKSTILAPINIRGRYFRRVGKTNRRMSHDEILQRMQSSVAFSWDSCIERYASLEDLNPEAINRFVQMVKNAGRQPVPDNASSLDLLNKLKLVVDGRPTRACLLLFGNDPEKYSPYAFLKLGRFRSLTYIVDDKEVHGTLLEQLDGAIGWFRERLETEFVITGKPQRDVIWEYPLDAIREAIINLLVHRDYTSMANSQVRLYDNSVEFWNPGGLPVGLTTAMLLTKHNSVRRNQSIAEAFFYMGLIERWGSGTTRMAEELQIFKHPLPVFESDEFKFTLCFYRKPEPILKKPLVSNLTKRQQTLIEYLKEHDSITNSRFQELANISARTATRELKKLTDEGVLITEGVGPATKYRLKK